MIANRMAIIHNGELVVQGDVNTLLDEGEKYVILHAEPRQKVLSVLKRQKMIWKNISEKEGKFEVTMDFALIPELNKALVGAGVQVRALIPRRSLEDLFLSMTERAT